MSVMDLNSVSALYPVIAVPKPVATAADFEALLPVERVFDSGWFVQLVSPDGRLQLGLVRHDHESVPVGWQNSAAGLFVTVDTGDANAAWSSTEGKFEVIQPLRDEVWGQRHFILRLAGNILVDVVEMLGDGNG
jgi:hypothetical protein